MTSNPETRLEVEVRDVHSRPLIHAELTLRPTGSGAAPRSVDYDADQAAFVADGLDRGKSYELQASAAGLEAQSREVEMSTAGAYQTFILGRKGLPTYRRDGVEVPFEPTGLIAVTFAPGTDEPSIDSIEADLGSDYDLSPAAGPVEVGEDLTRLFRFLGDQTDPDDPGQSDTLDYLLRLAEVRWAGPVVARGERSVAYLTEELILQVKGLDEAGVRSLGQEYGLELLHEVPYLPHTFRLAARKKGARHHPGYALLDVARELAKRSDVVWAEPNLAGTAEPDAVEPPDSLGPAMWDRQLIGTAAAWRSLKAAGKPPFGDPNLVLAVVDRGLDATHPDLGDRVLLQFDFRRMEEVEKKTIPRYSGHGTKVAGVAAAAQNENVAGVAPGCSLMSLIYSHTEADVCDMYCWAAGFDVHRQRRTRRAPTQSAASYGGQGVTVDLPEPPEQVAGIFITCMGLGFAKGPISGLARRTFDHLATQGRDGKGCLLFFSAGNNGRRSTFERPWATHPKTYGIAASTRDGKDEVRASYSNYCGIDLCAPSSDRMKGISTRSLASRGQYDRFGGTSSATPLAAGAAALVLSARSDLGSDQVRRILTTTAVKIDPKASGGVRRWLDENGRPAKTGGTDPAYSLAYGFGRVDAAPAVAAALGPDLQPATLAEAAEKKTPGKSWFSRARSLGDSPGLAGLSVILGAYHLIAALFLLMWPYGDGTTLAGVSAVLGLYHLVVAAVLGLAGYRRDEPDEEGEDLEDVNPG